MKTLKILLKWAVFLILFLLAITVLFYIWASSGTIPRNNLAEISHYPDNEIPVENGRTVFRIMSYNIGYLSGMSNNLPFRRDKAFFTGNLENFIQLLERVQPDFVGLQEIDFHSYRSHYRNQLEDIISGAAYPWSARAINWDKRYIPFPYWPPAAHFKRMASGQAVVSRFPILVNRRIVLEKVLHRPFYYRAFYLDRLVQVVKIEVDKQHLVIMNVHLEAFEKETRMHQAQTVLEIYRSFENQFPVLIIGDFNCIPPGATQKKDFSDEPGMDFLDHNVIELFLEEKSLSEAVLSGDNPVSEKTSFTFPADHPNRRLDYIFYNHRKITCQQAGVLEIESSDHLPIIMHFSIKKESG